MDVNSIILACLEVAALSAGAIPRPVGLGLVGVTGFEVASESLIDSYLAGLGGSTAADSWLSQTQGVGAASIATGTQYIARRSLLECVAAITASFDKTHAKCNSDVYDGSEFAKFLRDKNAYEFGFIEAAPRVDENPKEHPQDPWNVKKASENKELYQKMLKMRLEQDLSPKPSRKAEEYGFGVGDAASVHDKKQKGYAGKHRGVDWAQEGKEFHNKMLEKTDYQDWWTILLRKGGEYGLMVIEKMIKEYTKDLWSEEWIREMKNLYHIMTEEHSDDWLEKLWRIGQEYGPVVVKTMPVLTETSKTKKLAAKLWNRWGREGKEIYQKFMKEAQSKKI